MGADYGKVQRTLQDWLTAERKTLKVITEKPDEIFVFFVEWTSGMHVTVGVYKGMPHAILVNFSLALRDDQKARLDSLPKEQREAFLTSLNFALSEREDTASFNDYHEKEWLRAQRRVYVEDLTRTLFFEALRGLSLTHRRLLMILESSRIFSRDAQSPTAVYS